MDRKMKHAGVKVTILFAVILLGSLTPTIWGGIENLSWDETEYLQTRFEDAGISRDSISYLLSLPRVTGRDEILLISSDFKTAGVLTRAEIQVIGKEVTLRYTGKVLYDYNEKKP